MAENMEMLGRMEKMAVLIELEQEVARLRAENERLVTAFEQVGVGFDHLLALGEARDAQIEALRDLANSCWNAESARRDAEIATNLAQMVRERDARGIISH